MADTVQVHGLRELDRAFSKMGRDVRNGLRDELRVAAEPVRQTAERLAVQRISHIGPMRPRSWARMRTGQKRALVYIAPVQRGRMSRKNTFLGRPRFAHTLLDEAMEPALQQNQEQVIRRLEFMLDVLADRNF